MRERRAGSKCSVVVVQLFTAAVLLCQVMRFVVPCNEPWVLRCENHGSKELKSLVATTTQISSIEGSDLAKSFDGQPLRDICGEGFWPTS